MPRIHAYPITVPRESIDALGHVNNQEYVRWMQGAAIDHSEVQGWPLERYVALGQGWFVRRHAVEYQCSKWSPTMRKRCVSRAA